MSWREKERETRDEIHDGGSLPLCRQVRVLVLGDSGVGKTSLVHLILKGSAIARPSQTIGCSVGVKHITCASAVSSSNSLKSDAERDFFVELWDISGHERYKECRSLFYTQISGVIFVHDLSQRKTKTSLQKWAAEVAVTGSFLAPLGSGGPGGLPVPYLAIGNKTDIATKDRIRRSSGNLVDAARQWVEKRGLLSSSEELPLIDSFPGSTGLIAAAKEARYDKEAVVKFFRMLIRRRYFSDDLPAPDPWRAPNPWSVPPLPNAIHHSSANLIEDDQYDNRLSSSGEKLKQSVVPPLPAQRNLAPPPTLCPQQPFSVSENYSFQRSPTFGLSETVSTRSKRSDIIV